MMQDVFKQIDSCKAEYDKYHPQKFPSKICSIVKDRMCIINNYCKNDQNCIAEVKKAYPPYGKGDDEKYCLALVKSVRSEFTTKQ